MVASALEEILHSEESPVAPNPDKPELKIED
jgi:hypothetical protein